MTTEQLIKVALSYAGMTQAELADKIGMNKSNFNARMKRESFSRIEMEQIAKHWGWSSFTHSRCRTAKQFDPIDPVHLTIYN